MPIGLRNAVFAEEKPAMLTPLQIGQFRAMGFLKLEGCLSSAEVEDLAAAHERLITDAPAYDYFEDNLGLPSRGTLHQGRGPELDDEFAHFVEHERILEAQRDIFGRPCLYHGGGEIWRNMSDTPWHSDVLGDPERDPDFYTIKVAFYLDELDADSGSLNVIPGSHFPAYGQALLDECGYKEGGLRPRLHLQDPPGAVAVTTRPGDVVLFDTRIWHSAFARPGGRRTAFISYVPDPEDSPLRREQVRALIQPFPYSEQLIERAGPLRQAMIARMRELDIA